MSNFQEYTSAETKCPQCLWEGGKAFLLQYWKVYLKKLGGLLFLFCFVFLLDPFWLSVIMPSPFTEKFGKLQIRYRKGNMWKSSTLFIAWVIFFTLNLRFSIQCLRYRLNLELENIPPKKTVPNYLYSISKENI